jgi:hypothetical protein
MAAVKELKLGINDYDTRELFDAFDHNQNKVISVDEFILNVRGSLPAVRLQLIEQAFQKVDRALAGSVDIRDLKKAYVAANHPVVLDGRMTEYQAKLDFCDSFDKNHPQEAGFVVTFDEFADYYTNVSAVVASDHEFSALIRGTWGLDQASAGDSRAQRPLSSYNQRPKNFSNPQGYSGKESTNNTTITPSNRYYNERHSPIRKSIAYSPPRRDGFPYKETPGMTSNEMPLKNNNVLY